MLFRWQWSCTLNLLNSLLYITILSCIRVVCVRHASDAEAVQFQLVLCVAGHIQYHRSLSQETMRFTLQKTSGNIVSLSSLKLICLSACSWLHIFLLLFLKLTPRLSAPSAHWVYFCPMSWGWETQLRGKQANASIFKPTLPTSVWLNKVSQIKFFFFEKNVFSPLQLLNFIGYIWSMLKASQIKRNA